MVQEKEYLTFDDVDLKGKTVILRVDINSPIDPTSGDILGDTRIRTHLETIKELKNSRTVILAHQSRPGKSDFTTLEKHAKYISGLLKRKVNYIDDLFSSRAQSAIKEMKNGDIVLLENTRLFSEEIVLKDESIEKQAGTHIVQNLSSLADYYINDAFAAAHRSQTSLVGFTDVLPSLAGKVMDRELTAINKAIGSNQHPSIVILGGQKVDDSIDVAKNLLEKKAVDMILTTGVVANMFLKGKGYKLGKPSMEYIKSEFKNCDELIENTKKIIKKYGKKILTPTDLAIKGDKKRVSISIDDLPCKNPIYDIGLDTIVTYTNHIKKAKIIIANGPAGVFEMEDFAMGTNEIFNAIANSKGYSIVGGGETTAVVNKLGIASKINHISTGGGACINLIAGKKMPVVEALKRSKKLFDKDVFCK
jgi:phosphoglycerate kinase